MDFIHNEALYQYFPCVINLQSNSKRNFDKHTFK